MRVYLKLKLKMKIKLIQFFSLATLLIVPNFVIAAPIISGVNGDVLRGQELVISGQGFGAKTNSAPVVWDNFSEGNNGDLLSLRNGWKMSSDNLIGQKPQLSTEILRYSKAPFSAKFYFTRNVKYGEDLIYKDNLPVSGNRRYVDYWLWFKMPIQSSIAPDSLQHQLKLVRLQSGPGDVLGTGYPMLNTFAWRYAGGNRSVYNQVSADVDHVYENGNSWSSLLVDGAWNHVRTMIDVGTEGNADGILKVWLNGSKVLDVSANFVGVGLSNVSFFNNFQVGKYLGNTALSTTETTIYYSEVYYDDSWNRVEVCDAATYAACSHTEIQPFSAWSDSSVTVSLNQGSFPTGQTYLYVIDADGNVNANGFLINIDSADKIAPSAPSGLSVN